MVFRLQTPTRMLPFRHLFALLVCFAGPALAKPPGAHVTTGLGCMQLLGGVPDGYVPATVIVGRSRVLVAPPGSGPFLDGAYVVPVFGDIHGNLGGMLSTLHTLQGKYGVKFPFALQVGDFGYYPEGEANDGSSRKGPPGPDLHDGVQKFLKDPKVRAQMLKSTNGCGLDGCQVAFIRGNHEDHSALLALGGPGSLVAVEPGKTLNYLPDGSVVSLQLAPGVSVTVGVFGGIDAKSRPGSARRNPGIAFSDSALDPLLAQGPGGIDVLLTHQGTSSALRGSGNIDALVDLMKPQVHIHGHSHQQSAHDANGVPSYGLERIPNERRPAPGGFVGFLRVYPDGRVEFVFADSVQ